MERFYTNKENKPSVITRTHDLFDQYRILDPNTGTYQNVYGKYQEQHPSLINVLTNISKDTVAFKADPNIDQTDVQSSQKSPNTIYFTPEGIMLGGWLIAEPTPYDRIEALEETVSSLESVSGGALKFVGVISEGGFVDGLNTQEFSQDVVERGYSNSQQMSGGSAYESTNKVVGRTQLSGIFLNIEPFVESIVASLDAANSNNPFNVTLDAIHANSFTSSLKLVIPHGYAEENVNAEVIDITLPHSFTIQEATNIRTAKNYGYAGTAGDHENAPSGVMLYIAGVTGSSIQQFTQNTFLLGRPLRLYSLAEVAGLEAGYTFVVQDNCIIIPGDNTTEAWPGDFVIINNDVAQGQGTHLTANDISIIHTSRTTLASNNSDGLMSSSDFALLHTIDVRRASSSQIGQVKVPTGCGLKVDSITGSLTTNLSLDLAQVSGLKGMRLFLGDTDNQDTLTSVDFPQMTNTSWGVARIDDDTIKMNNLGQLYSTARLTWS